MIRKATIIGCILASASAQIALADVETISNSKMSFENCILLIQKTATQLGSTPVNVVETDDLRIVRFETNDGSGDSVLVTCSRADETALVTLSKN